MQSFARRFRGPLLGSITALLLCTLRPAHARSQTADATWLPNANSGDWNDYTNWSTGNVPTGTATFGTSNITTITNSEYTNIGTIVFNPGASAYTIISLQFNEDPQFTATGIVNNSGVTQTFVAGADSFGDSGYFQFNGNSTAGSNVTFINSGASVSYGAGGETDFADNSSAGSATIINNGNSVAITNSSYPYGGVTWFYNNATAGNATLIANGGTNGGQGGAILFGDQATGGTAKVILGGNGILDISSITSPATGVTIGSLASSTANGGLVYLGANNLSVGSDNTSTLFSGVIQDGGYSGGTGGSLTKIGTGTLTLTGTNLYTGGTTITGGLINFNSLGNFGTGSITLNGGGLQWASGTNTDVSGKLAAIGANGATFDTNGSNVTLASPLTGAGGLIKTGLGSLDLTTSNTYAGPTVVSGGSLIVDGSIAGSGTTVNGGSLIVNGTANGPVTVNSTGLLGGRGLIIGNVINSGIISPGNSPGTLTIRGNFTQNSTGTLVIQIAGTGAGQHDLLAISGTANLGGSLQVNYTNGFKFGKGESVTFLTAGQGVNGTFANVQGINTAGGALNGESIVYLPNAVEVYSGAGSITQTIQGLPGVTGNDLQTARMLDGLSGDPRLSRLFALLNGNTNLQGLLDDINLINPDRMAALSNIGSALSTSTLLTLEQRMVTLSGSPMTGAGGPTGPDGKGGKEVAADTFAAGAGTRWGFFITGSGEFEHVDSTAQARGFNFDAGGVTLGVDYRFSDHFVAGIYGGYTNTGIDIGQGGRTDVNDGKGGLYATYMNGGFYINTALGGGYTSYSTHRTGLGGRANSNTDGGDFTALFAPGYSFTRGPWTFGPTARFQYDYQSVNGFSESGSAAPMTIGSQHSDSLVSGLGVKASYDWKVGSVTVRPEVLLEWEHEYGDVSSTIEGGLANAHSTSVTLNSPTLGRDDLHVGAGVGVVLNDRWTVYAYYDGQFFRTNYEASTITGGFRMSF